MVSVNEVDAMKVRSARERILLLLLQGLDCARKSTQSTAPLSCRAQRPRAWGFWRHVIAPRSSLPAVAARARMRGVQVCFSAFTQHCAADWADRTTWTKRTIETFLI